MAVINDESDIIYKNKKSEYSSELRRKYKFIKWNTDGNQRIQTNITRKNIFQTGKKQI